MVHDIQTTLDAPEVIRRAKAFFASRMPQYAAFPEEEGPGFLTLRGQGGEEIALAVFPEDDARRVRASTLFFDQAVARFLSTLPTPVGALA
jgi:hypothetical protein